MTTQVATNPQRWRPSEIECVNLAKSFIKQFNVTSFLKNLYNKGLQPRSEEPSNTVSIDVNQQISMSKSSSETILFTQHEEIPDSAIMKQCRVFEQNAKIQCVTFHVEHRINKHKKKFKNVMTSLKYKMLCNHTDLHMSSNRYLITTWCLCGDPRIEQKMSMKHCLRLKTKDPTPARIEMDPDAQYFGIIHRARINIISRQHLIQNNITEIDETELQREGVKIDEYLHVFDVQWFRNKRFSQNLLLGVVLKGDNRFTFIVIDCKNKRVRRREVSSNYVNYQFLKYPQLSMDTLWGVCNPSESKEMSIGIMGSFSGSSEVGLEKFAQYFLLRNSNNCSKSWVKSAPNGGYLAHFSGMQRDKMEVETETDRAVSYRLGIIKIPQDVKNDESDVTFTFRSKPCGFTVNEDTNGLNAFISKIKENNPHIEDGLKVGLWIHTINMKVVDNNPYKTILAIIRRAPEPLTIGFKYKAPAKTVIPQKLGTHFWYNTSLELKTETVCNGMHWLNNDIAVFVIGNKLYVLGKNKGARSRNKVLAIWMQGVYGMVNHDLRSIMHKFIGFDLDKVYHLPDLKYASDAYDDQSVIDFYYSKNESIYCVYQNNRQQNKLIVL